MKSMPFTKQNLVALQENYELAMKDEQFQKLVHHLKWSKEDAMKRTTKLQNTIVELNHCKNCKGLYECQNALRGHVSMPINEENQISFTYIPCRYKKQEVAFKNSKNSEEKVNDNARMKEIDVTDKKRKKVIEWLDQFYDNFDFSKNMKGLYLHGNFGSGKTFLVSALLHELHEKKNVSIAIIYYPEILRDLKSDWENYDAKMKQYQSVDILCIDDIGAEKVTEWSRDEVLGTILQTRMNHNLTTFFTSNLTMKELENHFISCDKSDEPVKARRIMERIKQLSVDMELLSENRRDQTN